MNALIKLATDAELNEIIYQGSHIINIIVIIFFISKYRNNYGLSKKQAYGTLAIFYPIALIFLYVLTWAQSGFHDFGDINIVRGFIFFPLIALIPAKILKINKKALWDYHAPIFALTQAVSHIACMFAGCCHGYPSEWGLWNPITKNTMFPIQPIESLTSFFVFLICINFAKKENYKPTGKVNALFLILFGTTRFFLEFLRDNDKVLGSISNLALHAALMVFVGLVWWLTIIQKEARESKFANKGSKVKH